MHMKENISLKELTQNVPKEVFDYFVELRKTGTYGKINYKKLLEKF